LINPLEVHEGEKIINVLKLKSPSELSHRLVLKSPESSKIFLFCAFESFIQHQEKITSRFKNVTYPVIDPDCLGLVVKLGNTSERESGGRRDPKTFLFAGSHFSEEKNMPGKYACEYSGNVISISTFGDELLCLPGIHGHANDELAWKVNAEKLPKVGTSLSLRLRILNGAPEKARHSGSRNKSQ
jgi:hypothetical protein